MRTPYISILALCSTVFLHACSGLPSLPEDPHSLSNRVGNFSPARLDSDKAERQAAKLVTPLPGGSKNLDGQEENFDPSFGAPEAPGGDGDENQSRPNATPQSTGADVDRTATAAITKVPAPAPFAQTPAADFGAPDKLKPDAVDSSEFGRSQNGRTTVFMDTPHAKKPINESPRAMAQGVAGRAQGTPQGTAQVTGQGTAQGTGTPQGIGCPPAGMATLGGTGSSGMSQVAPGGIPKPARVVPRVGSAPSAVQYSYTPRSNSYAAPGTNSSVPGAYAPPATTYAPPAATSAPPATTYAPPTNVSRSGSAPDDSQVLEAQAKRVQNVPVTVTARVKRLLPDDRKGNPHQRFLIELSNGTTVLVAHNIDLAPYVPLQQGDMVTICGEYIWNEKGGVLHYTHHTTNARHRGGYIQYNRQTYQ